MTDCNAFPWEAAATLLTGFAAVFGAVCIAKKQTKILDQQVSLAELDQRIALFERRFKIYDEAQAFLSHFVTFAEFPTPPIEKRFRAAALEARFLFQPQVHTDIYERAIPYGVLKRKMAADLARAIAFEPDDIVKDLAENIWLSETLNNLHEVFGDELKLGEVPQKAGTPK
jgi:hypothetical protein